MHFQKLLENIQALFPTFQIEQYSNHSPVQTLNLTLYIFYVQRELVNGFP